jgi:ABC-2 type transport system ATP-binding protein
VIEIQDLKKNYGDKEAVRGLSLAVAPGEILGLVGPNGAGKTSTLRCIAGILPPSSGRVLIGSYDLAEDPVAAKSLLAYIPDDPRLFDNLTVVDHLRFMARLYRMEDAEERIPGLLRELDLEGKEDLLPAALSRGMKQKLAIGCAYIHKPTAILFDEPLTGLDPIAIRRAKDAIVRRAEEGAAIIVSSHLLDLVEELAHRILVIMDGTCAALGSVDELKSAHPDLEEGADLEDIFMRVAGGNGNGDVPPPASETPGDPAA